MSILENKIGNLLDEELFDLEKIWRNSLPRFSDKELLEIFPEVKQVIPEKISEWSKKRNKLCDIIERKLIYIRNKVNDEFSRWFWREIVKVWEGQELLEIDKHLARLKNLKTISENKILKQITEEQILQVLKVPIENLFNQPLRQSGRNLIGLCPFHKEKTPSFFIYLNTNSFYCHGCQKGGNVINFVEEFYNFSFKEAVEFLLNY